MGAAQINFEKLGPDQVVNHFDKTRVLATKSGLTAHLRNSTWFNGVDADEYYPRAYDLYDPLERASFVLNFKQTKAESIVRSVLRDVDSGTYFTHSMDVLEVAVKVCMRMTTDPEEVLDCGPMAVALGSVPKRDWEILQGVNLDDQ